MSIDSWHDGWAKVVAKAWTDPQFKEKLLTNPKETLQESGIAVPEKTEVQVVEHANNHRWVFALPPPPADLSEANVAQAVLRSSRADISCTNKCAC